MREAVWVSVMTPPREKPMKASWRRYQAAGAWIRKSYAGGVNENQAFEERSCVGREAEAGTRRVCSKGSGRLVGRVGVPAPPQLCLAGKTLRSKPLPTRDHSACLAGAWDVTSRLLSTKHGARAW